MTRTPRRHANTEILWGITRDNCPEGIDESSPGTGESFAWGPPEQKPRLREWKIINVLFFSKRNNYHNAQKKDEDNLNVSLAIEMASAISSVCDFHKLHRAPIHIQTTNVCSIMCLRVPPTFPAFYFTRVTYNYFGSFCIITPMLSEHVIHLACNQNFIRIGSGFLIGRQVKRQN